jgi:hypothetical protein
VKPVPSLPDPSNHFCKTLPEGLDKRVGRFSHDYTAGMDTFILKNCFMAGGICDKLRQEHELGFSRVKGVILKCKGRRVALPY